MPPIHAMYCSLLACLRSSNLLLEIIYSGIHSNVYENVTKSSMHYMYYLVECASRRDFPVVESPRFFLVFFLMALSSDLKRLRYSSVDG